MVVAFSASAQSGRESFFLWGGEGGVGVDGDCLLTHSKQLGKKKRGESKERANLPIAASSILASRSRPLLWERGALFSPATAMAPARGRSGDGAGKSKASIESSSELLDTRREVDRKKKKKTQPLSLFSLLSFSKQARAPTLSRSPRRPRRRTRKKRGQGAAPSSRASRTVRDEGEEKFSPFKNFNSLSFHSPH